jgi:hypothetical protein
VLQFILHDLRNEYSLEKDRQDFDLPNLYKVVQGTGVGDDEPHRQLESKAAKVVPIAIQVVDAVRNIDLTRLKEAVQRLTCRQSK